MLLIMLLLCVCAPAIPVQAGVAAADAGAAGLVLHARTADQQYSPPAHWEAVQQLVQAVPGLPVIGNGDVFEAADAVQLMRQTGCHGECKQHVM
jgi:tRNA-dihydrouridine synthase